MLEPFNQEHMVQMHLTCEVTRGRAVTSFESPVALFYTPITSMLLCGRILPTTGNFTQSTEGKSSISSVVTGVTVYNLVTAQIGGTTTLPGWDASPLQEPSLNTFIWWPQQFVNTMYLFLPPDQNPMALAST